MSQLHHISAKCITECKVTVKHQKKKIRLLLSLHAPELLRPSHRARTGWSETSQPSPPTELRPAIQSHAALPLTHYSVCVSWVTCMWMWYSVCTVCGCVCMLTLAPSVLPLAGRSGATPTISSILPLSLSRSLSPYSFTLCDPTPPPPLIRMDGLKQSASLSPPLKPCPDWRIKQWLFESGPDTDIHSLICIRNKCRCYSPNDSIRITDALSVSTPDVFLTFQIIAAYFAGSHYMQWCSGESVESVCSPTTTTRLT